MAVKIFIDPGHGGADSGVTQGSRKEKDDVLKLGLAVQKLLNQQSNFQVIMSRTTDTEPTLAERCKKANDNNVDYVLSLHRNGGGGAGPEAWVHSQATRSTINKAKCVLDNLGTLIGKSRGVKKGAPSYTDFAINRDSDAPSCLLEVGFLDNSSDNSNFDDNFNQIAKAIAKGVCEAMGQKYIETVEYTAMNAAPGDRSSFVLASKLLIKACNAVNLTKESVDLNGIYGVGTGKATKDLQKTCKLAENGIINDDFLLKIYDLLVKKIKYNSETIEKVRDIVGD